MQSRDATVTYPTLLNLCYLLSLPCTYLCKSDTLSCLNKKRFFFFNAYISLRAKMIFSTMNSIPFFYKTLLTKLHRPALWEHGRTRSGQENIVDSCYRKVLKICWVSSSSCRRNGNIFRYVFAEEDGLCGHVYVTAASRSLNIHRGTRRSNLLLPCVTSWCVVRITGLHRISNTFVTWHASLLLFLFFAISLFLRAGGLVPATIPQSTSSSYFSQRRHVPHAFSVLLTIDEWSREDRSADTPDCILTHREIFCHCFVVVTAPSCPFLETHSLSLPTFLPGCFSTTSHPVWSGLVSPGFTCL